MKLTAKELTRILNQPDYAIADGSLIDSVTLHNGPHGDLDALARSTVAKTPQRPSCAVWKNEREFQRAVVEAYAAWAAINKVDVILCHIANENAHKQPGVVGGMPDLKLCAVRGQYGGLYIELKVGDGKLSQAQRDVHHRLRRDGYKVLTIWDSVEDVIFEIEAFLKGDE